MDPERIGMQNELDVDAEYRVADQSDRDADQLLPHLVAHLREHRAKLRHEWADRIRDAHLLEAMTPQEMAVETTSVYDKLCRGA
jgi:rsbT co-antagonist protein RsbR